MNKQPETYDELIRIKRCRELVKIYNLTEEDINKIYDFLTNNPKGEVVGNEYSISLKLNGKVLEVIDASCKTIRLDGVILSNSVYREIEHYTPSSSSSGGYSGGSSSNNNNNNNNNNNR